MVRIYSTHFNSDIFGSDNRANSSNNLNEPVFNFQTSPHVDNFEGDPPKITLDKNNSVDINWRITYATYTPKNQRKYNKVHKFVENYAKKQGNKTADVDAITNMICKLSDDYQIDPEITATILAHETGGFVFTPKVMSARTHYKGVTQVDFTIVEILYASYEDYNDKSLTPHQRAVAYDHRHCLQDQTRIDELKEMYPTPQDLWKALETDVSLGVEVGIMAFKLKLHSRKGDTKAAIAGYCAGQYHLPADTTAQMHYDLPLPEYIAANMDEQIPDQTEEIPDETEQFDFVEYNSGIFNDPTTIKQILFDAIGIKNSLSEEEKELFDFYAKMIKYTDDGNVDINDQDTYEAIMYFVELVTTDVKIAEEEPEF